MAELSETPHRESFSQLLGNEIILPAQFWGGPARDLRTEPERRLMLAVLENAILTLHRCTTRPSAHAGRIAAEIRTWIGSNTRHHPFAFAAICDVLGIDASYLRGIIARWLNGSAPIPRPRRRHAGRGRHHVAIRRRRKAR